jgi:eukaryotic-like serine/threonine-protein kinase
LAVARNDIQLRTSDIWLIDLARNVPSRFTFDRANEFSPIWSPDGNQLAFMSSRAQPGIYQKRTSGGGNDELLTQISVPYFVTRDWSRDGRFILYSAGGSVGARNLWALPLTGDRKPFAVTHSEFRENHAKFSPNGRWMAYDSNESGRPEVYVQPFPQGEGKWQISNNSGLEPRWRADGKELFFLDSEGKVMSVAVKTDGAAFEADSANLLFQLNAPLLLPTSRTRYTVSYDGQRFLFNLPPLQVINAPITVILDWTATLRK